MTIAGAEAPQVFDVVYEITGVPAIMPDTIPVVGVTVAKVISLEVHDPPVVALLSVVVDPLQIVDVPDIADGVAGTVLMVIDFVVVEDPQ